MNYCFIDFEFTCDGKIMKKDNQQIIFRGRHSVKKSELISVGFVIMNSKFKIVKKYHRTVKPVHNPELSEYCRALTRLTQDDIDSSATADVRNFKVIHNIVAGE